MLSDVPALLALVVLAFVVLPFEQEAKLVTVALVLALSALLARARSADAS